MPDKLPPSRTVIHSMSLYTNVYTFEAIARRIQRVDTAQNRSWENEMICACTAKAKNCCTANEFNGKARNWPIQWQERTLTTWPFDSSAILTTDSRCEYTLFLCLLSEYASDSCSSHIFTYIHKWTVPMWADRLTKAIIDWLVLAEAMCQTVSRRSVFFIGIKRINKCYMTMQVLRHPQTGNVCSSEQAQGCHNKIGIERAFHHRMCSLLYV